MSVEDLVEVCVQFADKLPLMSLRYAHPGRSHQLVVMTIVVVLMMVRNDISIIDEMVPDLEK